MLNIDKIGDWRIQVKKSRVILLCSLVILLELANSQCCLQFDSNNFCLRCPLKTHLYRGYCINDIAGCDNYFLGFDCAKCKPNYQNVNGTCAHQTFDKNLLKNITFQLFLESATTPNKNVAPVLKELATNKQIWRSWYNLTKLNQQLTFLSNGTIFVQSTKIQQSILFTMDTSLSKNGSNTKTENLPEFIYIGNATAALKDHSKNNEQLESMLYRFTFKLEAGFIDLAVITESSSNVGTVSTFNYIQLLDVKFHLLNGSEWAMLVESSDEELYVVGRILALFPQLKTKTYIDSFVKKYSDVHNYIFFFIDARNGVATIHYEMDQQEINLMHSSINHTKIIQFPHNIMPSPLNATKIIEEHSFKNEINSSNHVVSKNSTTNSNSTTNQNSNTHQNWSQSNKMNTNEDNDLVYLNVSQINEANEKESLYGLEELATNELFSTGYAVAMSQYGITPNIYYTLVLLSRKVKDFNGTQYAIRFQEISTKKYYQFSFQIDDLADAFVVKGLKEVRLVNANINQKSNASSDINKITEKANTTNTKKNTTNSIIVVKSNNMSQNNLFTNSKQSNASIINMAEATTHDIISPHTSAAINTANKTNTAINTANKTNAANITNAAANKTENNNGTKASINNENTNMNATNKNMNAKNENCSNFFAISEVYLNMSNLNKDMFLPKINMLLRNMYPNLLLNSQIDQVKYQLTENSQRAMTMLYTVTYSKMNQTWDFLMKIEHNQLTIVSVPPLAKEANSQISNFTTSTAKLNQSITTNTSAAKNISANESVIKKNSAKTASNNVTSQINTTIPSNNSKSSNTSQIINKTIYDVENYSNFQILKILQQLYKIPSTTVVDAIETWADDPKICYNITYLSKISLFPPNKTVNFNATAYLVSVNASGFMKIVKVQWELQYYDVASVKTGAGLTLPKMLLSATTPSVNEVPLSSLGQLSVKLIVQHSPDLQTWKVSESLIKMNYSNALKVEQLLGQVWQTLTFSSHTNSSVSLCFLIKALRLLNYTTELSYDIQSYELISCNNNGNANGANNANDANDARTSSLLRDINFTDCSASCEAESRQLLSHFNNENESTIEILTTEKYTSFSKILFRRTFNHITDDTSNISATESQLLRRKSFQEQQLQVIIDASLFRVIAYQKNTLILYHKKQIKHSNTQKYFTECISKAMPEITAEQVLSIEKVAEYQQGVYLVKALVADTHYLLTSSQEMYSYLFEPTQMMEIFVVVDLTTNFKSSLLVNNNIGLPFQSNSFAIVNNNTIIPALQQIKLPSKNLIFQQIIKDITMLYSSFMEHATVLRVYLNTTNLSQNNQIELGQYFQDHSKYTSILLAKRFTIDYQNLYLLTAGYSPVLSQFQIKALDVISNSQISISHCEMVEFKGSFSAPYCAKCQAGYLLEDEVCVKIIQKCTSQFQDFCLRCQPGLRLNGFLSCLHGFSEVAKIKQMLSLYLNSKSS